MHIIQIAVALAKTGGLHVVGLGTDGKPYIWSNGEWTLMGVPKVKPEKGKK